MTRLTLALLLAWCGGVYASEVEPVAVLASTEGPTVDRDGNVYFTFGGITGGRILKWTDGPRRETQPGLLEPPGRVEVFRMYGASGLILTRRAGCSPANEGPTAIAPASRARISRTAASNGLRIVTRASDSAAPTISRLTAKAASILPIGLQ